METLILNPINPAILLGAGIALIALESVIYSFVVIWFGVASFVVGCISYVVSFKSGGDQLALISILALILLFVLRTKAIAKFMKSKDVEYKDDFYNQRGIGVIKSGMVYYKATYWQIDPLIADKVVEDQKVEVLSIENSVAIINLDFDKQ